MRKTNLLLIAFLLCSLGTYSVFAGGDSDIDEGIDVEITESTQTGSDEDTATVEADEDASKNSESITEKAKEEVKEKEEAEEEEEEENDGLATLPDGIAYVGAFIGLNIRDSAWGNILTAIPNDSQVTICGREGDWYKISSPTAGYVHARYVFDSPGKAYYGNDPVNPNGSSSSSSSGSTPDVIIDVDGDSLQGKIVSAAKSIHDQYQGYQAYPYHAYTEGGNLGCAQVATSVLCAAGALDATDSCGGLPYATLGCETAINMLEAKGWQSVDYPPYQAGDVVFWTTYLPGASHVGIVMNSGNSAQAMNNSSSMRQPNYSDIEAMTIYRIYRKC